MENIRENEGERILFFSQEPHAACPLSEIWNRLWSMAVQDDLWRGGDQDHLCLSQTGQGLPDITAQLREGGHQVQRQRD